MSLDRNLFSKLTDAYQLKEYYVYGYGCMMGGFHLDQPYTLSLLFAHKLLLAFVSLMRASQPFFSFHSLAYLLYQVKGPIVFACFDQELHKPQTQQAHLGFISHFSLWYLQIVIIITFLTLCFTIFNFLFIFFIFIITWFS